MPRLRHLSTHTEIYSFPRVINVKHISGYARQSATPHSTPGISSARRLCVNPRSYLYLRESTLLPTFCLCRSNFIFPLLLQVLRSIFSSSYFTCSKKRPIHQSGYVIRLALIGNVYISASENKFQLLRRSLEVSFVLCAKKLQYNFVD